MTLLLLVLAATALLLFRSATREGLSPGITAALLTIGAASTGDRLLPRPQIFTYLGLALLLDRLGAARAARRCPWELIAIQALWANAHSALIGLGAGVLLVGGGALPHLTGRQRALLLAGLGAASAIHPQGILPLLDNVQQLAGGGLYRQTVREWLPLFAPGDRSLPQAAAAWIVVALALAGGLVGLATARRGFAGYALLLLLVGAAPLGAERNRDLAAMVLAPALAALPALRGRRTGGPLEVGALAVAGAAVVVPALGLFGFPPLVVRPGLTSEGQPAAAVAFLRREPVGSRIFNVYDEGGYLLHHLAPSRRVFIDGRYFVYGEPLYREYLALRDGAPEARARLGNGGADLLLLRYPGSDGYMALAREARAWSEWHLVYWDDESLLYARDGAAAPAWLDAHAYRRADPLLPRALATDAGWWRVNFVEIVREAWRASSDAPRAIRPLLMLAVAFEYNGRPGDADRFYREILTTHPASRPAREGRERLAGGGGSSAATPTSDLLREFGLAARPSGGDGAVAPR